MPTKIKELPPLHFLKEAFLYDHLTGILIWNPDRPESHFPRVNSYKRYLKLQANKPVTGKEANGYLVVSITVEGRSEKYKVHRICWALYYNKLPPTDKEVDHKDRNRINNKGCNLRLLSSQGNTHNREIGVGKSKYLGVSWRESRKHWVARIDVDGKSTYLGSSKDEEKAYQMYLEAKKVQHPTQTLS